MWQQEVKVNKILQVALQSHFQVTLQKFVSVKKILKNIHKQLYGKTFKILNFKYLWLIQEVYNNLPNQ